MISLISILGCEKAEIQRSVGTNVQIESRTVDCDDCPIDDCCCGLELLTSGVSITFRLCNTTSGIGLCSGGSSGGCSPSNNGGTHFTLSSSNLMERFCVNKGDAYWIQNTHSTQDALVKLTCQSDFVFPQIVQITIPAGQTYYFDTNNDCDVSSCQ